MKNKMVTNDKKLQQHKFFTVGNLRYSSVFHLLFTTN